jgi:predicted transcriptional regulator
MQAFTVRLADDEHRRLDDYAHARRLSMAKVVRVAIIAYLDLMETSHDEPQSGTAGSTRSADDNS